MLDNLLVCQSVATYQTGNMTLIPPTKTIVIRQTFSTPLQPFVNVQQDMADVQSLHLQGRLAH